MKAKRAQFSDLPSNFDIRNYSICAHWDLGMWVSNLFYRIVRKSSIEGGATDAAYMKMMRDATQEAFDNPELNWGDSDEGPIDGLPNSPPALAQRVRDLSSLDSLRGKDYFANEVFSKYVSAYEKAKDAINPLNGELNRSATKDASDAAHFVANTPEWKMMRDCWGEDHEFGPFALATIDLRAPDEELIADFRIWLAEARKNRGIDPISRSFAQADLDQWADMNILAYIDLTLWAQARSLNIGGAVMGRALFPSEFDIGLEDRVRKVVAREARKLMNKETLRSMQSQHIKAEREKEKFTPDL